MPVNLFPDGNKISAKSTGISADGRTARRHGQIAPMPLGEANLSIDYEECECLERALLFMHGCSLIAKS